PRFLVARTLTRGFSSDWRKQPSGRRFPFRFAARPAPREPTPMPFNSVATAWRPASLAFPIVTCTVLSKSFPSTIWTGRPCSWPSSVQASRRKWTGRHEEDSLKNRGFGDWSAIPIRNLKSSIYSFLDENLMMCTDIHHEEPPMLDNLPREELIQRVDR